LEEESAIRVRQVKQLGQMRLLLHPLAHVEVACFADRLHHESVLVHFASHGVGSTTSALLDFAVEGPGRSSVMPRHGLDSIDLIIAEGRRIHGYKGGHLEASGAAAPNVGRPSKSGRAVNAGDALPGAVSIEVTRSIEGGHAFEA